MSRTMKKYLLTLVVLLSIACRTESTPPTEDHSDAGIDSGSTVDASIDVPDASVIIDSSTTDVEPPRPLIWHRAKIGELPTAWDPRDGASLIQLGTGRILLIGGWTPYDPFLPPSTGNTSDRTTNQVWKSDDEGRTWQLLLPHDPFAPKEGPNARFPIGHAIGVVNYKGHAILFGRDANTAYSDLDGDVWTESNNGATWTRVAIDSPAKDRSLFMAASYKDAIYIMGGQRQSYNKTTALNDVWRSNNGGVTWTQLANAPWSPRGMVYGPAVNNGKLFIVGGGNYDQYLPDTFNGVYSFDGESWETVLPDGHLQFAPGAYQPLAAMNGRLWIFNGYNYVDDTEHSRAVYSDDDGRTWSVFENGSGGPSSHADAVGVAGNGILRVSGNLNERNVWIFFAEK